MLLLQLTAEQFEEWKLYYGFEPWGQAGNDLQHSYTRKTFADVMGAKNQKKRSPTIDDMSLLELMSESRKQRRRNRKLRVKPKQRQSVDDMKKMLFGIASYHSKGIKSTKG